MSGLVINLLFPPAKAIQPSPRPSKSCPYQYAVSPHCCTAVQFNSVIVPYPHHFPHYTGAVWGVRRDVPSDSGWPAINIRIDTQWYSGYYPYITGCVGCLRPTLLATDLLVRRGPSVFCQAHNLLVLQTVCSSRYDDTFKPILSSR